MTVIQLLRAQRTYRDVDFPTVVHFLKDSDRSAGPGPRQDPGILPGYPTKVAWAQVVWPPSAAFPGALAGAGLEVEQQRLKQPSCDGSVHPF